MEMYGVIMAGGVVPVLATKSCYCAKQFLNITGDSMINDTIKRIRI